MIINIIVILYCIGGEDFRLEYSYLRELRNIMAPSVNIMALTATASDTLISHCIRDIGMIDPVIVQVSPVKDNFVLRSI